MFRHLLVPLDGSTLSEASLVAAAALAKRFGSSVTLLHIIERDAPAQVHHERHLTTASEAQVYLEGMATREFALPIKVQAHVHEAPSSDVAGSIVQHAAEMNADLIVTCTHGRGGMRDLLFGSIAQQVVAQGRLPLLLIKPGQTGFVINKVLVALDPDSLHDASIAPAAALAAAFQASLSLLSVIPTVGTLSGQEAATSSLLPIASQAVLDLLQEQTEDHLQQHVAALEQRGLVLSATVARGEPAQQILRFSDLNGIDLIALSTHRKAGLEAFWSKSVAPRVAEATRTPLLLLPL